MKPVSEAVDGATSKEFSIIEASVEDWSGLSVEGNQEPS